MTVVDAPADASADEQHPTSLGDYAVGDWIRVRGEIDQVFRIERFDVFADRPAEVLAYGGTRKKDEWIGAAWRSFHASRIAAKLRTAVTATGGVAVLR